MKLFVIYSNPPTAPNKEELLNWIELKYGPDVRFHTCSAENLTPEQLIVFLDQRGKFLSGIDEGLQIDSTKVCSHE